MVSILSPLGLLAAFCFIWALKVFINGLLCPISHIPGTWHSRYTRLALKLENLAGRRVYYVHTLHKKYGPVVRVSPIEIAIADADGYVQIHKVNSGFIKGTWYAKTPPGDDTLFATRDPVKHGQRRRLFARPFSNTSIKTNWGSDIRKKVELAVSKIKRDAVAGKADMYRWWTLMTMDIITHIAFGESFHMLENEKKSDYVDALQMILLQGALNIELPWLAMILRFIPHPKIRRITTATRAIDGYGEIALNNMRSRDEDKRNLFRQAVNENQTEKVTITDISIRHEATSLTVAGADTTAVAITYIIWNVLKRPELQKKLEQEIADLSYNLDQDELESAQLLNGIIQESLRLHGPAAGALPRIVPRGGVKIAGHFIPEGTTVSTHAFSLHRDESIFPNALVFDETRFMGDKPLNARQAAAYAPFGIGSRGCIGVHIAWIELRYAVALFFRECKGARIHDDMTDEMMEQENRFIVFPKAHRCHVAL